MVKADFSFFVLFCLIMINVNEAALLHEKRRSLSSVKLVDADLNGSLSVKESGEG